MLDEEERRRFDDIAQRLGEDRRFARQVNTAPPMDNRPVPWAAVFYAVLVIIAPNLMILGGWPLVLPVLGVFAVASSVIVLRRRRRSTS